MGNLKVSGRNHSRHLVFEIDMVGNGGLSSGADCGLL